MNYFTNDGRIFYINRTDQTYTNIIFLSDVVINTYSNTQRKSSPRLAKLASIVLRSKNYGTISASLAGSVLSQAEPKAKLLKGCNGMKTREYRVSQSYKKYT